MSATIAIEIDDRVAACKDALEPFYRDILGEGDIVAVSQLVGCLVSFLCGLANGAGGELGDCLAESAIELIRQRHAAPASAPN